MDQLDQLTWGVFLELVPLVPNEDTIEKTTAITDLVPLVPVVPNEDTIEKTTAITDLVPLVPVVPKKPSYKKRGCFLVPKALKTRLFVTPLKPIAILELVP